jgi:uncharacterized protein
MKIIVEQPDLNQLIALGVKSWPIWTKEVSIFPWDYNTQEIAYILEGEVTVTPKNGGEPVNFGAGDLVTFPSGLSCVWQVKKALKKHYQFR